MTDFSEKFPQLAKAVVEVEDVKSRTKTTYSAPELAEYLGRCSNPACDTKPGLNAYRIIEDMVKANETRQSGTDYCRGYTTSPGVKRGSHGSTTRCRTKYNYQIELTYKK
jgi:hypothetical protein